MDKAVKDKLLSDIKHSFDAESVKDLVKYFEFLTKEIERILSGSKDKKEALRLLEEYDQGQLEDTTEIDKLLPDKKKISAVKKQLVAELAEFEKEFDIVETLYKTAIAEVKERIIRTKL